MLELDNLGRWPTLWACATTSTVQSREVRSAPGGRPWAFGLQSFTNYGKAALVVGRVVLLHPRDEHLVGSYVVPGDRVLGVVHWPVRNPQTQPAWKDRKPVHGFRLAPGRSFNMVLVVAAIAGGRRATSQGMLVYYQDSSGTRSATILTSSSSSSTR